MKPIILIALCVSLSLTVTPLIASERGVAKGMLIHLDIQKDLCAATIGNNSSYVISKVIKNSVILKRDFNRIHCKKHDGFNGGNLYQTAFHYDRFNMISSFLYEHKLDINLLDNNGDTLLDWVDKKIATYTRDGDDDIAEDYKELRLRLLDFGSKNTAR